MASLRAYCKTVIQPISNKSLMQLLSLSLHPGYTYADADAVIHMPVLMNEFLSHGTLH